VEPYIYILLTSERNTLACYDLWGSRKKDEEPWKIWGGGEGQVGRAGENNYKASERK
jgi:hypothetical protein